MVTSCKSPLLAILELKEFYGKGDAYFKFVFGEVNARVKEAIVAHQEDKQYQLLKLKNDDKNIEIEEINHFFKCEQKYIPLIIRICDSKQKYWEAMINGF